MDGDLSTLDLELEEGELFDTLDGVQLTSLVAVPDQPQRGPLSNFV